MKKSIFIATAAAFLCFPGLASSVLAAPAEQASERKPFSTEDRAAFLEARIAALKVGLRLTPTQEKNWPSLESALRDIARGREARRAEWRAKADQHAEHHDVIEGLRRGVKHLTSRAADLEKMADAAKPLYDTLDDAQKSRFGMLLHAFTHKGHGGWGGHSG